MQREMVREIRASARRLLLLGLRPGVKLPNGETRAPRPRSGELLSTVVLQRGERVLEDVVGYMITLGDAPLVK